MRAAHDRGRGGRLADEVAACGATGFPLGVSIVHVSQNRIKTVTLRQPLHSNKPALEPGSEGFARHDPLIHGHARGVNIFKISAPQCIAFPSRVAQYVDVSRNWLGAGKRKC